MAHLPKPEQLKPAASHHANGATKADDEVVNIFPEYYLIEVGHFQNLIRQPIDEWIYLFKNSAVRDDFHSRNIQAAKAKLTVMQMSEADRKAYEQFLLSRANALDVMTGHFQQGIEIGKEQGIEFANRENARKMRDAGLDPTFIARITGLTEAEILAL
jgi:predicted transposase/invertase (TIGR01784 family)